MKIISKYKDFYDFLTQDFDSEITYLREPMAWYEELQNLYEDKKGLRKYSGFLPKRAKIKKGHITFGSYVFGIYPYVYSQPFAEVHYETPLGTELIILTRAIIEEKNTDSLIDYCWKNLSDHARDCMRDTKLVIDSKDVPGWIDKYTWKVECKEIFGVLRAPVFVEFCEELFQDTCYSIERINGAQNSRRPNIITNISFGKLGENILKYWYDELNDLNTYINIENFLWSIKEEPEIVPDNKTKIVSHGFDLKTSFRKM